MFSIHYIYRILSDCRWHLNHLVLSRAARFSRWPAWELFASVCGSSFELLTDVSRDEKLFDVRATAGWLRGRHTPAEGNRSTGNTHTDGQCSVHSSWTCTASCPHAAAELSHIIPVTFDGWNDFKGKQLYQVPAVLLLLSVCLTPAQNYC